ncbi:MULTISPECIES: SpoVR family protein [Collimonas]|uniref:SpoVR like family protein n=1 Tax=Collimonas pratensis TaxID=279113 RepID=A0A127QC73_9BURK|nr:MULTISPECIES: SpoVR family protein [Collimonas]AMP07445.1 spoVR like family protein [Collimonas pratensis]AMP17178.1 spoVR like family protein [Collimonas pratensis]NKI71418.1 SpoVR family protein [Collimonas pratensis]HWW99807.1 SpoVR family protein [Collimonas sp.]
MNDRLAKGVNQALPCPSDWSFDLIEQYNDEIARVAASYKLDIYPIQLEIITAEQMMDAYASAGMPVNYRHWSFGKHFLMTERDYKRGQMGLAYEIVINSNPCIAYLMEENTMTMQALVVAHAAYGHNSFFKGNYLFQLWTDAHAIIDYLVYAKAYIAECEERYGFSKVEELLDSCHALMHYGVDRYKRPQKLSLEKEQAQRRERAEYMQSQVNELWRTLPEKKEEAAERVEGRFPPETQENLLYFAEKNSPLLESWEREVIRIVRKVAQYFYPQRQTQVMNEGWATFWHYTILNTLYDEGKLTDGFMMEFLHSHSNVVYQPPVTKSYYSGINPYALGFGMMSDIRRICEKPTEEDYRWFPELAGTPWLETLHYAMRNFKDESFVAQYLSPKLIRDMRLFAVLDDENRSELEVSAIHNDAGYQYVRQALSRQYDINHREPNIQVWSVNTRGDRSLTLRHFRSDARPLAEGTDEMLRHMARLWQFDVYLESVDDSGNVLQRYECVSENKYVLRP